MGVFFSFVLKENLKPFMLISRLNSQSLEGYTPSKNPFLQLPI